MKFKKLIYYICFVLTIFLCEPAVANSSVIQEELEEKKTQCGNNAALSLDFKDFSTQKKLYVTVKRSKEDNSVLDTKTSYVWMILSRPKISKRKRFVIIHKKTPPSDIWESIWNKRIKGSKKPNESRTTLKNAMESAPKEYQNDYSNYIYIKNIDDNRQDIAKTRNVFKHMISSANTKIFINTTHNTLGLSKDALTYDHKFFLIPLGNVDKTLTKGGKKGVTYNRNVLIKGEFFAFITDPEGNCLKADSFSVN